MKTMIPEIDEIVNCEPCRRAYCWTERPTSKFLSAEDAIKAIEGIGGIPVLAHPGEQKLTKEHIEHLAETGIRGIEIYTFKHTQEKIAWLVKLAKGLNLFGISGTDFHDPYHRAQVRLGRDRLENHLIRGASLEDFKAMGACIYTA